MLLASVSAGRPVLVVAGQPNGRSGQVRLSVANGPASNGGESRFAARLAHMAHSRQTLIPLVAGLAAVVTLYNVDLKWPNDLLRRRRQGRRHPCRGDASPGSRSECGLNLWWPDPPSDRTALWPDDPGPEAYTVVGAGVGQAIFDELALGAEAWSYDRVLRRLLDSGPRGHLGRW